jgi:glycosyltransferase involved in cell wall biosynthesis
MKISIIIPIYGVEKYIAHCARSLFSQKGALLEYIFVNDATRDHSMEILNNVIDEEYAELRNNIKIINKQINEGLPLARKSGVSVATGDYVMHCDADDWLAEGAIEGIANVIEETNADAVYYNYYKSYEDTDVCSQEACYDNVLSYISGILSFSPLSGGYCWNKVIKRSLYKKVYKWPTLNMHEDVALMPQVLYHAKTIKFIERPLYHYRCSSTSSMSTDFRVNKKKRTESKNNQLIVIDFMKHVGLDKVLSLQYKQLIARCAYDAAFYDQESITSDYLLYKSLWHETLFWNFDVSIRRQLQSRFVILLYGFRNWLTSLL